MQRREVSVLCTASLVRCPYHCHRQPVTAAQLSPRGIVAIATLLPLATGRLWGDTPRRTSFKPNPADLSGERTARVLYRPSSLRPVSHVSICIYIDMDMEASSIRGRSRPIDVLTGMIHLSRNHGPEYPRKCIPCCQVEVDIPSIWSHHARYVPSAHLNNTLRQARSL